MIYLYNAETGDLLSPILGQFSLVQDDLNDGQGFVIVPNDLDLTGVTVNTETGELVVPNEATQAGNALSRAKDDALRHIDRKAGSVRSLWVSDGVGQQMVYQEKAEEARRCLEDESPDAVNYPHLSAEIGITGATLTDVATAINAKAQGWLTVSGTIEAVRLGTKAAIQLAETPTEIKAIIKAANWPAPE